jgi:chromosome segregation ATPase
MSIASAAAMVSKNTNIASTVEDKMNNLQDRLLQMGPANTKLGSDIAKLEGYINMFQTQIPITYSNLLSMTSSKDQLPQNQDLANKMNYLQTRLASMQQEYEQLIPKVIYLKSQFERSKAEEQELLDQKNALKIQYDLAQSGEKMGQEFEKNAVDRMSFKA